MIFLSNFQERRLRAFFKDFDHCLLIRVTNVLEDALMTRSFISFHKNLRNRQKCSHFVDQIPDLVIGSKMDQITVAAPVPTVVEIVFIGSGTTILYHYVPVAILLVIIALHHTDLFVAINGLRKPTSTYLDLLIEHFTAINGLRKPTSAYLDLLIEHFTAKLGSIDLIVV